jgi:hypothetical protein
MPYVAVPVPEQDLMAVYELLLARSGRRTDAPPPAVAANDRPKNDEVLEQSTARIYRRVTDEGRAALNAAAEKSPGELNFDEFEAAARVPNMGAALQSIAIQSEGEPAAPLVEKRRVKNRYRYSMTPQVAAIIRELANEGA